MSYIRQIQQSQPNKRRRHDESNVFTSINGYSRHISTKSSKNPDHKADGELRIEGSDSLVRYGIFILIYLIDNSIVLRSLYFTSTCTT